MYLNIRIIIALGLGGGTIFLLFLNTYFRPTRIFLTIRRSEEKDTPEDSNFIRKNKAIYSKVLNDRYNHLNDVYHGNIDEVIPWDGEKATYLWDFFPPAWNCPLRERLGKFSEGGKVACNVNALRGENAVVYSYGVRNDISFEVDLADRTNVTIYAFDPSVESLPYQHPLIKLQRTGLSAKTEGKMETLEFTMRKNGHKRIDLLKVDCEGCEWEALTSQNLQNVDQLLIELHFGQHSSNKNGNESHVREVFKLFETLEACGLYPFSWEVNHNPSGYFNQKPWAIEYSFVRWDSKYMLSYTPSSKHLGTQQAILAGGPEIVQAHRPAIVYLSSSNEKDITNLIQYM